MPNWRSRTDEIERLLEEGVEAEAAERQWWLQRLRAIDRVGPATNKDRVIVNNGRRMRPQWWRVPRRYGTPLVSFGLGLDATRKAASLPRWRIRRGIRIGMDQGGANAL